MSENVAIITGGASGIGQAITALLLERGWRVAIFDLEGATLEAARAEYAGRDDVRIDAVDVTDEALVHDTVASVDADFGAITGLVNCAGIAGLSPFFDTTAEHFRKVLDVNVVGTFNAGKAAALRMRERGRGAIVNIASISGLRGSKDRAAYGASKGGVVTLTQVMAVDLAEHRPARQRRRARPDRHADGQGRPTPTPSANSTTATCRSTATAHRTRSRPSPPSCSTTANRATSPARSSPSTAATAAPA